MMRKESLKYKVSRKVLFCTAFIFLYQTIQPTIAWALTGGPGQPQFSSFEPVATTNMVSDFTGDFTYNLPVIEIPGGANGGGYSLSLSYHSGASPEEDASWVGYGWTLNPGAITRNKRGFPDDDDGATVDYWNKTNPNRTVSVGADVPPQAFSVNFPVGINVALRYNNYKGFGVTAGVGVSFANGLVSLGYSVSDGEGSFSVQIDPAAAVSDIKAKIAKDKEAAKKKQAIKDAAKASDKTPAKKADDQDKSSKDDSKPAETKTKKAKTNQSKFDLAGSSYGIFTHSDEVRGLNMTAYTGGAYNLDIGFMPTPTPLQVGFTIDATGSYNWQANINAAGVSGAADPISVYGYMYSGNAALNGSSSMMDYYTERLKPYKKEDHYLGIPFNNADDYMVSGEGLGGGFRMYNKLAGVYHPNAVQSHITVINLGAEVEAGLNIGAGLNLGVGYQTLQTNNWDPSTVSTYPFADSVANVDEPYFFRFDNDLGGSIDFGSNDNAQQAGLSGGGFPGDKSYTPDMSGFTTTMNDGNRSSRSSYIGYHTNKEMLYTTQPDDKEYVGYEKSADVNNLVDRASVPYGVGEFAVYNEDGQRYTYGLPVYARNELNMEYDLQGVIGGNIKDNYLAYRDISDDDNLQTKVGQENDTPYATTYLLTEITSPDYVDRTQNGPTPDDYGGYTKFSYKREYGSYNKGSDTTWYRWRMPYTGLLYNRGSLSTPLDDVGSVMTGEKELYYLDTIQTKTHFAVFRTSARADGVESADNNTAANSFTAQGSKTLQELDEIQLYAKNNGHPQLIKTVHFEYYPQSDEMCKDIPNTSSPGGGKLTLKRVWFEYNGVVNAKISPYVFKYSYPTLTYPAPYTALSNYGSGLTQNPNYSYFDIDPWGNYQSDTTRFARMQNWVNQNPPSGFDPAAWQLKSILLPTGGEIDVQYEQKDYSYVQDKPALAMVSLSNSGSLSSDTCYLHLSDIIPGTITLAAEDSVRNNINNQYVLPKTKMYFKFLYNLIGTSNPTINDCSSEYITGYCNVKSTGVSSSGVYVILGNPGFLASQFDTPREVALNFLKTQRAGNLDLSGNCDPSAVGVSINASNSPWMIVQHFVGFLGTHFLPADEYLCAHMNYELSYLRIPVIRPKKGGGVRVKRLLMYDQGIESGDASLFGSEYSYLNTDGTSSGVASNEPSAIREENALVVFDPNLQQSFLSKVISGRDKDQTELPLGESILPSPSVGYGRVVVTNIHTGKTNPGFTVKEFYTSKDYPMQAECTPIQTTKDFLPIPGGLINYFVSNLWMTQGYSFKLNAMNGQAKSVSTYAGTPTNMQNATLSTQEVYHYFQPGEKVPMMGSVNNITYSDPGKESDVTFETRGTEDKSKTLALAFDADLGIFGFIPLPFLTFCPSYTYTESKMYTDVASKVIQYPAIIKSTTVYADGIYHTTENIAFNPSTGQPILTRTTDGYNNLNLQLSSNHSGTIDSYTFPASETYPDMGAKSANERRIIVTKTNGVKMTEQTIGDKVCIEFNDTTGNGNICASMGQFYPGDFIKLCNYDTRADLGVYNVSDSISGNDLFILPTAAYGTPTTSSGASLIAYIIKSGRTNQLSASVGGVTTYGDTLQVGSSTSGIFSDYQLLASRLDSMLHLPGTAERILPDSLIPSDVSFMFFGKCSPSKDITLYVSPTVKIITQYCTSPDSLGAPGGHIIIDPLTNQLAYSYNGFCTNTPITCPELCPKIRVIDTAKVLSADAQVYGNYWSYDPTVYPVVAGSNPYESGMKGKWRVENSYVYNDTITGANLASERNYKDAGVFRLELFNWSDLAANDTTKWLKTNTIDSYSPDGNDLEEQDILGIYSAAKFGYGHTQPYLMVKNADYGSVQYESFENVYGGTQLEDGLTPLHMEQDTTEAHSGKASWKLPSNTSGLDEINMKPMVFTSQEQNKGLLVKVWVRDTANTLAVPVVGRLQGSSLALDYTFTKVARTGDWTLYQANITGSSMSSTFSLGDSYTPYITNAYAVSSKTIWLDDLRIQPEDAEMMTYVYDVNTLRLITSFDDQNFGLYYQYNAEGKLVRKKIETLEGIKTVTETQYHVPLNSR